MAVGPLADSTGLKFASRSPFVVEFCDHLPKTLSFVYLSIQTKKELFCVLLASFECLFLFVFRKCSAPGKVLIVGGYAVLEHPNPGLVLAVSARFYSSYVCCAVPVAAVC